MTVIGITGGIGCGKSEVCRYLEERYGALVLMADDIAHEVIEPGGEAYEGYMELFGPDYVLPDGTFDRKKIGDLAFKDPGIIQKMNAIVHPAVHQAILSRIEKGRAEGRELAVIEAALLIEANYRDTCREYWYVYSNLETRIQRLLMSRDITEDKIESVVSRQQSEEIFRSECEFVVDNSGDFEDTKAAIDERIKILRDEQ